jgi:AcrR family transcriptional regulator
VFVDTGTTNAPANGPGRPRDPRVDVAITEAAIGVIRERGWAFTMEEVARKAGVSKTSVYRRYPTKIALAFAAWEGDRDLRFPNTDTGSIWGDLTAYVMGTIRMTGSTVWSSILPVLLAESRIDPVVSDTLGKVWDWRLEVLRDVLDRGIARREIPADTDIHQVREMIDGPILLRIAVTGEDMPPTFADRLVEDVMSVVTRS